MNHTFGPWTTAISDDSHTQLSAFWKRRMTMLPLLAKTSSVPARRGVLLVTAAAAILMWAVPTFCDSPALAQTKPAAAEKTREQRIHHLEKQVEALLKEIKALREAERSPAREHITILEGATRAGLLELRTLWHQSVLYDAAASQELALSRMTYALPKAKAETLAAFLRDYVKVQVMETKVEGDALTVTTTPDVQKSLGQLISLLTKEAAK